MRKSQKDIKEAIDRLNRRNPELKLVFDFQDCGYRVARDGGRYLSPRLTAKELLRWVDGFADAIDTLSVVNDAKQFNAVTEMSDEDISGLFYALARCVALLSAAARSKGAEPDNQDFRDSDIIRDLQVKVSMYQDKRKRCSSCGA
jgi:hypothetical protein